MSTNDGYGPFGAPDDSGPDSSGAYGSGGGDAGSYASDSYGAGAGSYGSGTYDGGAYGSGTYRGGSYGSGTSDGGSYESGTYGGGSYGSGTYDGGTYGPGTYDTGPYGSGPHGSAPSASDPYAAASSSEDPYAADAVSADDFGPEFSSSFSSGSTGPTAAGPMPTGGPVPVYSQGSYYGGQYLPPAPTSGLALAGFIVSIASLIVCTGLLSPVGLVLSILGMRDTSPTSGTGKGGRGFAIAGLVISILGTLLVVAYIGFFVLMAVLGSASSTY
ncbi:DUF4190 domain-containing protein [Brachybacterium alimentarium]|uniref:DUF4190 domain-containing protein n=1 Tax=Brachybacterium alimentarium TaxID=47845 RepID=UPI00403DF056